MASEKLITGQNAAKKAEAASPGQEYHDVTDPEEEKVVLSCLQPSGQYYAGNRALDELKKRLAARGIKA